MVYGLMVPYIGFFDSIPRGVAQVLMYLWTFDMAFLMWPNCSRVRPAHPESAAPEPAEPPTSPH